ncbi:MAG: hypothetical protein ACLFP2_03400 [Candidatus Woesearchaeota archaeon]
MKNMYKVLFTAGAIAIGAAGATYLPKMVKEPTIETQKVQQLEQIVKESEDKTKEQAEKGFIDPEKYTGTISDQEIEVHVGKIEIEKRNGYEKNAQRIPVTIKIPKDLEEPGQERFITYTHSEDAHYFIPNTGKMVTGRLNPDDGKVWYQTTLDSDGMKLRAGPGASKTTNVPGHCNELYIVSVSEDMAQMLPGHVGLHGMDNFKDMYSGDLQAIVSPESVEICTGENKFDLEVNNPYQ